MMYDSYHRPFLGVTKGAYAYFLLLFGSDEGCIQYEPFMR